jgi:phosphoglycolate phosphatase
VDGRDPQPVRGLILDLDGTIADSLDFLCELACEVFDCASLPRPERRAVIEVLAEGGSPALKLFPRDFPDPERFVERIYRERWSQWLERYGRDIPPLPGACEAVVELHDRGLALALVTSSPGTFPFLERWGIRERFVTVIGREAVRNRKPHPEPLETALEWLRLTPAEVLNVGDSPLDVQAGNAAGLTTVGVLTGVGTELQLTREGARAVLPSLAALPDFLARRFSGKEPA